MKIHGLRFTGILLGYGTRVKWLLENIEFYVIKCVLFFPDLKDANQAVIWSQLTTNVKNDLLLKMAFETIEPISSILCMFCVNIMQVFGRFKTCTDTTNVPC